MSSASAGEAGVAGGSFATALPVIDKLFPFFCVLDAQMRISVTGSTLPKLIGEGALGKRFDEVFTAESLFGPITSHNLRKSGGQLFIARHGSAGLRLRGQVIADPDSDNFLVAWSPWVATTQEFDAAHLSLADFGVQDPIVDMLHLLQAYERAEREAAAPLERLGRFFAASPDLMMMLDFDGRIRQVNHSCEVLFGAPADRIVRTNIREWIDEASLATAEYAIEQLTRGVGITDIDAVITPSNGAPLSLQWAATSDVASRLIYATARDVSQAAEARQTANRILESAPNAMLIVDQAGIITYSNTECSRVFGYSVAELVGQPIELLVPVSARVSHVDYRAAYVASDPSEKKRMMGNGRDLIGVSKDGDELPLQVTLSEIVIETSPHTLAAIVDISARKALEHELLTARDAAVALAQAKSEFLANTSHEIRTPLTSVIGLTELLLDTQLSADQRQMVTTARTAGDRLLSLVNDVLAFSKGDASQLMLDQTSFNPAELVEECARIVAPGARSKNLEMSTRVMASTPAFVLGDREKLRTVVLNLAGNAVKFTESGTVEMTVGQLPSGQLQIQIRDTGIGFESADSDPLFSPFVQADPSTTRRYGGSGLGLAITKQMVDVLGGTIEVRSMPGQGSTFKVNVPLHASAAPDAFVSASTVPAGERALPDLRVLLVEDDLVNSTLIAKMLAKLGAKVRTAMNGVEALDAFAEADFDVILMDCHMPTMDGFEATRRLRRNEVSGEHQIIVALTASALDEDRRRCIEAGMDAFLSKPLRLRDLADSLAEYLT